MNESQIMREIYDHGPVVAMLEVYHDFRQFKGPGDDYDHTFFSIGFL